MKVINYPILGVLALSAVLAQACTRAQAKVVPELPPLDVPAPPPRHVEAAEAQPPAPPPPPEDPVPAPPAKPSSTPAVQQRPEPKPEPPRVEVPAPEPPKPADESRTQPQGTLQTQPAGREAQLERNIRDMLARASANLNRIAYGGLNNDARIQYDQAKRFISQAEAALRDRNLVFADNLADKANTLAAQLAGR